MLEESQEIESTMKSIIDLLEHDVSVSSEIPGESLTWDVKLRLAAEEESTNWTSISERQAATRDLDGLYRDIGITTPVWAIHHAVRAIKNQQQNKALPPRILTIAALAYVRRDRVARIVLGLSIIVGSIGFDVSGLWGCSA